MNKNSTLYTILFIIYCHVTYAQENWIIFSPKGQDFEVWVPGEMRDGQKKLFTDVGEMSPTTWIYTNEKDKDPNFLYMVSIIDYPELTFDLSDKNFIKEFFDETLDQHLTDIKGELVYEADMPLSMYPGRVFRATWRNGDFVVRGRLVLVKDRFYMLQVYTEKSFSLNNEANKFLESLKVKPQ